MKRTNMIDGMRSNGSGETEYEPNRTWLWQSFAFMLALFVIPFMFTPKSDPMFIALLVGLALMVTMFAALRSGTLSLKNDVLKQSDLIGSRVVRIFEIRKIKIVRHGVWGGTHIIAERSKIAINHSLFDEQTRKQLIRDLLKINPLIAVEE